MTRTLLVVMMAACSHDPEPRSDVASSPVEVGVGQQPIDVATGDLDGDGTLDLVSANATDRTLSVRLRQRQPANGPGWRSAPDVPVDVPPHMVALADLDGDRDLDLVVTTHDSGLVWAWLNDGHAAFASVTGSPFTAMTTAKPHNHGLATGDLDGDGDADVVVADQDAKAVVVLRAQAGGALVAGPPIDVGGQPYPPALGDVDGDGRLDLVAPLVGRRAIAVLLGDGRGGFAHAPASPIATTPPRPYAIALLDVDGDRSLDIVASHDDTDELTVLLNTGRGTFRTSSTSPISAGRRLGRLAIVDFDRDGTLDLVGVGSNGLVLLRGDGHAGFTPTRLDASGGWIAIGGDLDNDGAPDVAAPEPGANVVRVWSSRR